MVHSAPFCASQPISFLTRNLLFLANFITYFVNICNIYKVKSLSKSVKWSMRQFPSEQSEGGGGGGGGRENYKAVIAHIFQL